MISKKRILTGDTPTGRLHLGHWVGSLENRVALQDEYDCYFIVANVHAFTTRAEKPAEIRTSVLEIVTDYLAAGIDPARSTIFVQSEVPAIAELTFFFAMLLPFNRVMKNPTLKDEIRDKGLGDSYPFGFPMYAVGQTADILTFRPEIVPVGEDQLPHLEMTREVARRFDQLYCGVDSKTEDRDFVKAGGLFPVIEAKLGRVRRLVGTGAPSAETGQLLKMSKSLNNAIFLSDDPDTIRKRVMSMYTDPNRKKATDPGTVENNPLWIFHETFNPDKQWVAETQAKYRAGGIGDVDCKKKLVEVLVALIDPIRQRRAVYEKDPGEVLRVLREGTARANAVAEETLYLAKKAMGQDYFARELKIVKSFGDSADRTLGIGDRERSVSVSLTLEALRPIFEAGTNAFKSQVLCDRSEPIGGLGERPVLNPLVGGEGWVDSVSKGAVFEPLFRGKTGGLKARSSHSRPDTTEGLGPPKPSSHVQKE